MLLQTQIVLAAGSAPVPFTTAWKAAGTCSNAVTAEGAIGWSTAAFGTLAGTEVSADDGTDAVSRPGNGTGNATNSLSARNFGFTSSDIPSGAVIDGVEIRIRKRTALSTGTDARDLLLQLINHSAATSADRLGSNQSAGGAWTTTETLVTHGGASDLWGGNSAVITQALVTSSAFGVHIRAEATNAGETVFTYVDLVECRIHGTA